MPLLQPHTGAADAAYLAGIYAAEANKPAGPLLGRAAGTGQGKSGGLGGTGRGVVKQRANSAANDGVVECNAGWFVDGELRRADH